MTVEASTKPGAVREARARGDEVARTRGFDWLARSGLHARGVIYLIVGAIAIKVAAGLIAFGVYSLADVRYDRI
jgi:hypothetical protein